MVPRYEGMATRADEVLCLNVEDLHPQDKRGKITAKGGAIEWIHQQSGTAQLLPLLIGHRTRGPLFLTDRKAPAGTPAPDVCPETGRATLSCHRAEEIFEENTRLLANPPRLSRRRRGSGRLDASPSASQCPHARRGRRHLLSAPMACPASTPSSTASNETLPPSPPA